MRTMMKDKKVVALLIGVVTLALFATVAVYASGKHEEGGCRGHQGMSLMKDARFEVINTSDGVIIIVTSEKPEATKMIQARFANFGKCREASGHGEGSEDCKKAHESAKVMTGNPGHIEGSEDCCGKCDAKASEDCCGKCGAEETKKSEGGCGMSGAKKSEGGCGMSGAEGCGKCDAGDCCGKCEESCGKCEAEESKGGCGMRGAEESKDSLI